MDKHGIILGLLVFAAVGICLTSGSNILIVGTVGTKSHSHFYGELIAILAARGHQITVVSAYGLREHPNVTQIKFDYNFDSHLSNTFSLGDWKTFMNKTLSTAKLCVETLGGQDVQNLNITDFDLMINGVVTFTCFVSLIDKTEIPLILYTPNTISSGLHDIMGNLNFPSFVPMLGSGLTYPMTFLERTINLIWGNMASLWMSGSLKSRAQHDCNAAGLCNEGMDTLADIERRASLMFINNVPNLDSPRRPYMPSVVSLGGLNCKEAKPLPQDLASWARDSGKHGFIYLSLGTALKPSDMPEEHRQIMVRVFRSLPQRVLWKWDNDSMDDLPPNVKLAKWLPQQDVLGDANIKLFITHGGLFSNLEATFHAVPLLGMPVFADQSSNIANVVSEGWGEVVNWNELTEDLFRQTITELITNKKYADVVQRRSAIMRDVPMSAKDTAVYWTEYVIRHKGAPHLRSPVLDMAWYQVYNLDIWAVLLTTLAALLLLLVLMTSALVRCCYRCVKRKLVTQGKRKQQ